MDKKYDLQEIINAFYQKFWNIVNEILILKSLVYFDDIIEEELILKDKIILQKIKKL